MLARFLRSFNNYLLYLVVPKFCIGIQPPHEAKVVQVKIRNAEEQQLVLPFDQEGC